MKRRIYFVDPIGIHSGMKYYADSFKSVIDDNSFLIKVISNYSENDDVPFFYNFYKGNLFVKILKLLVGSLKILVRVLFDRQSIYILFSYGTVIDILLHFIFLCSRNHIVDVHEVIQQGSENNKIMRSVYSFIFKRTGAVFIHSKRSESFLKDMGFVGKSVFVPHFEYNTSATYNIDKVSIEVQKLISEKINVLWFGNITYSKGIDLYIDNINLLSEDVSSKINFIICGHSLDGVFEKCDIHKSCYSVLLKRLNDDEMIYLYTQSDYVVLPYRQTSQSGVLEMAFHYQKPVIVSNIPYFELMLSKYPSFGLVTSLDSESFNNTIKSILYKKQQFYTKDDLYNYKHREDFKKFKDDFYNMISKM